MDKMLINTDYLCNKCRICEDIDLVDVIDLGDQYITSRFPLYGDYSTPKTHIVLTLCQNCSLLQLKYTTNSSELYEYEYGYRSGINDMMKTHLKQYQEEILTKMHNLNENDIIIDIGSNDATMLKYYDNKYKRIGIDPTGKQFSHFYGDVELIPTYFTKDNFKNIYKDSKAKIVSSISMFYDLPNPVQFARDIYDILDDNGIWTCEQSYLITMLNKKSIDTICHEHLEYYSLTAIKKIADMSNFKIIDIKFNDCNGGSFRIYFSKKSSKQYSECTELIDKIMEDELHYDIKNPVIYKKFIEQCDTEINKLKKMIDIINKNHQKIYIYGASTKGNCLLQYADIKENTIKYAVERNLNKIGKMTSTGIGIISEDTMRDNPPDYLLVLPWHFRDDIIKRENTFLENGGQLIFPFPHFEIYTKKQKVLITGCDGMIAKYVLEQFNDYSLYGFTRRENQISQPQRSKNKYKITRFDFDVRNTEILTFNMNLIKPEIVIHLAGISSSLYAYNNPIETLELNGMVIANICNIIHKNNWNTKVFNASSSEIFKGHQAYNIKENDTHYFHQHPYSIGKILGHSIIDFYRNNYNLPFSNGILFTIESKYKKDTFLLNKISNHSKRWIENNEPLTIGQIDSYRNILHAFDAARAIKLIIDQDVGDNYIISSPDSMYSIMDLVINIYKINNIFIEKKGNLLIDLTTNKPVAIIENKNNKGIDMVPTQITGEPTKLMKLGWKPVYDINYIITEISN